MNSTTATMGTGRAVHFAYYVGDKLTGTYCDRAAWETKRVRPMHSLTADDVTCKRCQKVAASPEGVPNVVAGQLAELAVNPSYCGNYPDADHTGCPSSVECSHAVVVGTLCTCAAYYLASSIHEDGCPLAVVADARAELVEVAAPLITAVLDEVEAPALSELSDDELAAQFTIAWANVQSVTKGKSNRAIDANWATYDALRAERDRRLATPRKGPSHNADACAVRGCVWIDAVIR